MLVPFPATPPSTRLVRTSIAPQSRVSMNAAMAQGAEWKGRLPRVRCSSVKSTCHSTVEAPGASNGKGPVRWSAERSSPSGMSVWLSPRESSSRKWQSRLSIRLLNRRTSLHGEAVSVARAGRSDPNSSEWALAGAKGEATNTAATSTAAKRDGVSRRMSPRLPLSLCIALHTYLSNWRTPASGADGSAGICPMASSHGRQAILS